jgi:peptide/nickel transport system permease protein
MNLQDTTQSLRDFWKEFSKEKSGIVGLALLALFVFLGIFGNLLVPFPGAKDRWRDIDYWQDNPQAAPPVWTNAFVAKKGVVSAVLKPVVQDSTGTNGAFAAKTFTFDYKYNYDKPPRDLIVKFQGEGVLDFKVDIVRPDGLTATCVRQQIDFTSGNTKRVAIGKYSASEVIEFVRGQDDYLASTLNYQLINPVTILFSKLDENLQDQPTPLKGDYKLVITASLKTETSKVNSASVIVSGNVSGLLGTDIMKRDIFTGLILGVKWALVIGILTSILTVIVGVVFGVSAAYFGGVVDWILSRLYEIIYLLPVLPFLIVISAIYKPSIWTLIIIICLFFWAGVYKPVYSMTLQIREETFVEASRALGSSKWRIIFKHIVPILLPYSFAVMALSIPGIIVYEASVSLLGLGDSNIVTWGQLLHDALGQGAVINNLWWWVVPPGLTIALMGMSFAFLGTALDKILHPKLKTR